MMDTFVQWATILSPIIAVGLAWWTSRTSTKSAKKQIAALKELEKMQINLLQLQITKEMIEANLRSFQAVEREYKNNLYKMNGGFGDSDSKKEFASEHEFQSERFQWLQKIHKTLDEMKSQIK